MPASPDTYVIYGHGSFDSASLETPVPLPPKCKVHFVVGHLKEIGDEKMVDTANWILNYCTERYAGNKSRDWWDDPDVKDLVYETFDSPNLSLPDYILGDTAGLYTPSVDLYRSPQAMVIINSTGKKSRLSQILGSKHWKNRREMTHFVWCGCRALNLPRQDRSHHREEKWNSFRNGLILDLH